MVAREMADAAAASARKWLGTMHPEAQAVFRIWTLAVTSWKKEAPGPAVALAEGVLFDCLGRTDRLMTNFTYGRAADRRFQELARANRFERAATLFEAALKSDPTLLEARFRAARIRSLTDEKAAEALEGIATSQTNADVSYLAAVNRAVIAQDRNDTPAAIRWYEYAQRLRPGSTAAAVGLGLVDPGSRVRFASLDSVDPYYTYPCRILTASVATELTRRIGNLPSK
jgi:tetratricopeptide (TPR) repeat protein